MKFAKYDGYWYKYDDTTPIEHATMYNIHGAKITGCNLSDYQIVEADDYDCLDWTKTTVLMEDSKYGWLDREGKFYGCSYEQHEYQARFIHKKTRRELEELGWIAVGRNLYETGKPVAMFYGAYEQGVIPTDAQVEYLSDKNGIDSTMVMNACLYGNREKARIYEKKLRLQAKENIDILGNQQEK